VSFIAEKCRINFFKGFNRFIQVYRLHPFLIDVIPNDQLIPTGEDDMAAKVENELVGLRVVEGRYSSVDDFIPHECV